MKRKSTTILIIIAAVIGMFVIVFETYPIKAREGTCGENLTWRLQNRTLTISGTGAMTDFDNDAVVPWNSRRFIIKRVIISDGVSSIGNYAFDGCRLLRSVNIPNSVTSIGESAFFYCTSLRSITIPHHITMIPRCAFYNCSHLQSINLPYSLQSIDNDAFSHCSRLTDIHIPRGVKYIGEYAFLSCSNLSSVCIPNSVQSIGHDAFWGCQSLTSITLPESVKEIGNRVFPGSAFWCCPQLTIYTASSVAIDFPSERIVHITQEEALARYNRMNNSALCGQDLEWILEDHTLTIIGTGKMYDYTNDNPAPWCNQKDSIQKVVISEGVTSIGDNAFRWYENITSISLSKTVKSIGETAFNYCRNLKSINLPLGLTSIGAGAFNNCISLTSITIPKSVKKIGGYAFNHCVKITVYTASSVSMANMGIRPDQIAYTSSSGKAKKHLDYMGVEMKGSRKDFCEALRSRVYSPDAILFTKDGITDNTTMMSVIALHKNPADISYSNSRNSVVRLLTVQGANKSDQVYKVEVQTTFNPKTDSWDDIKQTYLARKKYFTQKYGNPTEVVEKFEAPYSETNNPVKAILEGKVHYRSEYKIKGKGEVTLLLDWTPNLLTGSDPVLYVIYYDEAGLELYRRESKQ